jgi:hypothetical protein
LPLPFLKTKNKHQTGLIVQTRASDASQEPEDHGDHAIEACAQDLINAIHAKDMKGVAAALRAAIEMIKDEPQDESNDFDSQNQKAAEEA